MTAEQVWQKYDEWCKAFDPDGELDGETLARFYDMEARTIRAERTLEALEAAGHINAEIIKKARRLVAIVD